MKESSNINIAVLLTCHNRRDKTINALNTLFDVCRDFNEKSIDSVSPEVFLTDDGCSDGTAEAVSSTFADKAINIVKADGSAFWAGGMRLAWQAAIDTKRDFDFYLLINDDTVLKSNCLEELLKTHWYALENYDKGGVYTGFVSSAKDETDITYGAKVYKKGVMQAAMSLVPTGEPQSCNLTNGNILMVASNVVKKIGILDKVYIHAGADMDYGIKAERAGFPVLTTATVCGYCENDHDDSNAERDKVMAMSLKKRKAFLDWPPVKQYHDSLIFYWRYNKLRYVVFKLSYYLNLFWPSLYYKLYGRRGH